MTISNLISAQSSQHPQKIAVQHGENLLTYASLNKRACQLARYLMAQGLQANDVVALMVNRSPEMIILFLAMAKVGITYLPIDILISRPNALIICWRMPACCCW